MTKELEIAEIKNQIENLSMKIMEEECAERNWNGAAVRRLQAQKWQLEDKLAELEK